MYLIHSQSYYIRILVDHPGSPYVPYPQPILLQKDSGRPLRESLCAIVSASMGVQQGSPTSFLLFVLFVNDMIKLFKQRCGPEGFLN